MICPAILVSGGQSWIGAGWTERMSSFGWDALSGMLAALREQSGLKLEVRKAPMDVFAISRIERPNSNWWVDAEGS